MKNLYRILLLSLFLFLSFLVLKEKVTAQIANTYTFLNGKVGIGTTNTYLKLQVNTGTLNNSDILSKITSLPIMGWNYKAEGAPNRYRSAQKG